MTMKTLKLLSCLASLSILGGCAGSAAERDAEAGEVDQAELRGASSYASADGALTVDFAMIDGVQASTRDKRFTKVTLRRGPATFSIFCGDYTVRVAQGRPSKSELRCYESTFGEDADYFEVAFVREGVALHLEVTASWEADMFAERYEIASGHPFVGQPHSDHKRVVPLTPTTSGTINRDPIALISRVETAAATALGKTVHIQGNDGPLAIEGDLPIAGLSARFSADMTLHLDPTFGTLDDPRSVPWEIYSPTEPSLLRTAGKPSSGVVTPAVLASRIADALGAQ